MEIMASKIGCDRPLFNAHSIDQSQNLHYADDLWPCNGDASLFSLLWILADLRIPECLKFSPWGPFRLGRLHRFLGVLFYQQMDWMGRIKFILFKYPYLSFGPRCSGYWRCHHRGDH